MIDILVAAGIFALILGSGVWVTNAFARWMYCRCPACGTLNARRRAQCRICGETLETAQKG